MTIIKFSDWKRAVFRCGKDIKGLRGGVHRYATQVSLQVNAATTAKFSDRKLAIFRCVKEIKGLYGDVGL